MGLEQDSLTWKKKNVSISLDISISLGKFSFPLVESEHLDITHRDIEVTTFRFCILNINTSVILTLAIE